MKNSIIRYTKYTLGLLALIFTLSPLLGSDESTFINTAMAQEKRTPPAIGLTKDHPIFQNAIVVQNKHSQRLMNIQGVLGTGVGVGPDGQPVIKLYLERAGISNMPVDIEGVPVKLEVTGMIVAFTNPASWQPRPVPLGVSSGHPDITAGTIGARVIDTKGTTDTSDDEFYALSNNHVYANSNDALTGDIILQPGDYDGGDVNNVDHWLGTLHDFEEIIFYIPDEDINIITNNMDAAIAVSDTASLSNSTPIDDGYGIPSSTTVPAGATVPVQKYGRTTGLTEGTIQEINVLVDVCYEQKCKGPMRCTCTKAARFVDQFSVKDNDGDANTSFSAGGDSGSLIVTDDVNKNPVGLLFAGNSNTGYTFASPIVPILNAFGVTIDDTVGTSNNPPMVTINIPIDSASFNSGEIITFNGSASDTEDGDIPSSLIWTSTQDGQIGTSGSFSSTLSDGTHTITASVTDSDGNTESDSITVTVTPVSDGEDFSLNVDSDKVRGTMYVDLTWSGAVSHNVAIYRNGNMISTTLNDGTDTDSPGKGGGTFEYKICEENSTTVCSNTAAAVF